MTDVAWRPLNAWTDMDGQQWAEIEWHDGKREVRKVSVDVNVQVNGVSVPVTNVKVGE